MPNNVTPATILRETKNFTVFQGKRGVRIVCKDQSVTPRSHTIRQSKWDDYYRGISDQEFDDSCVMDLGIGVFEK